MSSINPLKYLLAAILALLICGCSLKKNTALTRHYSAFTTRYNIYFNGHEAFKEALTSFEKSYEDDYSDLIYIHPVSALADQEMSSNAGFDRAIEKSQKAIKLRTMPKRPPRNPRKANDASYKEFLKRSEYNPFLQNAWMLLGESQFYKGDFLAANATFLYISRNFWWLPETVAESQLWMARCYIELGWLYEAENILSKIEEEQLSKSQKGWFATVYSGFLLKKGDLTTAIPYLETALKATNGKAQRTRIQFLLGQIYAENNNPVKAYKAYQKVIRMNPSYRTLFNANIKQTEVMPGGSTERIEKKLSRMLRDPRNMAYVDQIYYAQGNLFLQQRDTLRTIEAYQKALSESTRNGMDKAVAAIKLGDLTFMHEDYIKAQPAFATAVSILPKTHKEYARIARLSEVLDKLMVHAETVHLQDSLLTIAALPESERLLIIQNLINKITQQERDAENLARREQFNNDRNDAQAPPQGAGMPAPPTLNTGDNSWYFYNKGAVNAGKIEFQRRWGTRKPEDNWRRRNKTEVIAAFETTNELIEQPQNSSVNESSTRTPDSNGSENPSMNDFKNPDYYLAQLPLTPQEKANAEELIQDALFNMGLIIEQQLENFPLAIKTFEDLNRRFPDNIYKLDSYYDIFMLYNRMNRPEMADLYKNRIIAEFPSSTYGVALQNPNYLANLRAMASQQETLYEETYEAYLSGRTDEVHQNFSFVERYWPLSSLMPKFLFLHALSYVPENDSRAFKESLERLTTLYSNSDVAPLASQMLSGLAAGRRIISDGTVARGLIWESNLFSGEGDSSATLDELAFESVQEGPHLLVLAYPTDSIQVNQLLFEIARYNFTNYMVRDFDLEVITFNNLSMLIVKGFNNFEELSTYRLRLSLPGGVPLPEQVIPVMISDANFRLLLQGRSFSDYFRFIEESTLDKVEAENPEIKQ